MKRRTSFNPKRRIRQDVSPDELRKLAASVSYGGNPEHKSHPGDYGLKPLFQPKRPDKSRCDAVKVSSPLKATKLLRLGIRKGLISEQERNGFPQNIWAVTEDGWPLEAQLENRELGTYHGYPMPDEDSFRDLVLKRWDQL